MQQTAEHIMSEWIFLDEGTFNKVYYNSDRTAVLKIQKDNDGAMDTPERSVRIWNEINSDVTPPAYLTQTSSGKGWVCPYIDGEQASDEEIAKTLLHLFNRTGRIVVDAPATKNFLKTPAGKIVCIDIGMALKMERNDETYYQNSTRRNSFISLSTWLKTQQSYDDFFQKTEKDFPLTVKTTKALLFIKSNRPDIHNIDFLTTHPSLIDSLALAYTAQNTTSTLNELDKVMPKSISPELKQLKIQRPINLETISKSCAHELQKYIISRGWLDRASRFFPNLTTTFFRNKQLTRLKVLTAKKLINAISKAESYQEIQDLLNKVQSENGKHKTFFTASGLGKSLAACRLILEVGKQNTSPTYTATNTAESNFLV